MQQVHEAGQLLPPRHPHSLEISVGLYMHWWQTAATAEGVPSPFVSALRVAAAFQLGPAPPAARAAGARLLPVPHAARCFCCGCLGWKATCASARKGEMVVSMWLASARQPEQGRLSKHEERWRPHGLLSYLPALQHFSCNMQPQVWQDHSSQACIKLAQASLPSHLLAALGRRPRLALVAVAARHLGTQLGWGHKNGRG